MEIGVREFRNHLSRWLEAVRSGEEIVVTDRGRPVARVVAPSEGRGWDRLLAQGLVQLPATPRRSAREIKRVKSTGSVSELVRDQRR